MQKFKETCLKALGFISLKYKSPSTCESCSDEFICGATVKGCWCMKIKLNAPVRQELKSKFKDCLCQNCLESYASSIKEP
jgi:hypothetical protein